MTPGDPRAAGTGDRLLDSALRRSRALVGAAQSFALGLEELGEIDLPPVLHGQIDQAQLRVIASLYLASDLEEAGVIPAVERLSGLARGAGVPVDLGKAAPLVAEFWRARNDRATETERHEVFARLFGGTFETLMLDLCEALYKLDELATNPDYGGIAQQTRVRSAATRLLEAMADGGGGITAFLAQEIMAALKAALAILGHPDLKGAFGARDVWGTVAGIDRMAKTKRADPRLFVRRGRSGLTVLAWLADVQPHLDNTTALLVSLNHPVIPAAVDWMEAALAIGEMTDIVPQPADHAGGASGSSWAALAA